MEKATKEYTCSVCGETFQSAWSDEDAIEEKTRLWGDLLLDQCSIICDICNTEFMAWLKAKGGTA